MLYRLGHIQTASLPLAQTLTIAAAALLVEAAFGFPDALFRAVKHPVVWVGGLIDWLDRRLNHGAPARRRVAGIGAVLALAAAATLPSAALTRLLPWPLLTVLASSLLAQRSLHSHVAAVAAALDTGGLAAGRVAVGHIVGRDPETLDAAGVVRAAMESLAENFSDGVVAPALWCCVAGLPGIAFYKAVNTADSMVGHRTPRHEAFGWAAARLDDLINLPASRLAALWLALASGEPGPALRAVWRDARHHRSPNAGWPEAAMAGGLGLRLAGPRVYAGVPVADGWMGSGRADATVADLRRALRVYRRACAVQVAVVVAAALILRG